MHPVSSICITCDTWQHLCGPCAMDSLSSHHRVSLACRNPTITRLHHEQPHPHPHPQQQHHHHREPMCSAAGTAHSLGTPFEGTSSHAGAMALSVPVLSGWQEAPLKSPRDWIQSFAPEIVSHIDEAPVFHLIYDKERATTRKTVDESDISNPDSWPEIRRSMMASNPDAIIFVQSLDGDSPVTEKQQLGYVASGNHSNYTAENAQGSFTEASEGNIADKSLTQTVRALPEVEVSSDYAGPEDAKLATSRPRTSSLSRTFSAKNRIWGVVVLGKSMQHACYVLQTTKVLSPAGAATHFSLTKAKCFAPSIHQQLEQSWLVN